jgi:LytR_cpsA_psr family
MHKRAVAAVALLGVVILATVAILVGQQRKYNDPQPTPSPTSIPAGQTLLVQVRGSSLLALGSVLMGVNGERTQLDQLWWLPEWWIDQVGAQEVSAADLGRKPVPFVMTAVQNQTQVPVDDAWIMDRLAFAGLVDAVGGVRVDLPSRTAYLNDRGLPEILEAGPQTMAGARAADFVLDPSLRNERIRLRRFQSVWDQILRRFPTDQEKARTLVVSMGALSKPTMTTDELADYLSTAKDLQVAGKSAQRTVPLTSDNFVRVSPPQGVQAAYALDTVRMQRRMAGMFAGSEPLDQPVARVYAAAIRNEALETMRDQMSTRGWASAWGGRTSQMVSGAIVTPEISDAQAVGLQTATGMIPARGELPWGSARVDVSRTMGS